MLFTRLVRMTDKVFAKFLKERALPKFEAGTLEHGVGTWRKLGTNGLRHYIQDEYIDLGWYYLMRAAVMEDEETFDLAEIRDTFYALFGGQQGMNCDDAWDEFHECLVEGVDDEY